MQKAYIIMQKAHYSCESQCRFHKQLLLMEPAKECTLIEDYIMMWTSLIQGSSKDHAYHQPLYVIEIECSFCKKTLVKKKPISISQDLWITCQKERETGHDTKRILEEHGTLAMIVKGLEYIQQNYKGHCWAVARASIFHKNQIGLERHSPPFQ